MGKFDKIRKLYQVQSVIFAVALCNVRKVSELIRLDILGGWHRGRFWRAGWVALLCFCTNELCNRQFLPQFRPGLSGWLSRNGTFGDQGKAGRPCCAGVAAERHASGYGVDSTRRSSPINNVTGE